MRVSTLQTFNTSVAQMQKGQTNLAKLQEQISTGKALLRPSDDPVAAAQILKLERELARFDAFEENADVSRRRIELEELTLGQIDVAVDRVRELTLQAGSGTLTDADRGFVASELRELQRHILGLMNTRDAQGEYLFGGSKGFVQPFVQNGDGSFSYQGDDGQRFIQVGAQLTVASSDSGREAFNVIADDISVATLGAAADTGAVSLSVTDPESTAFRQYANQYGDITLNITNIVALPAPSYDYALIGSDGNPVLDSLGVAITGTAVPGTPVDIPDVGLTLDYTGAVPSADLGPVTLRATQNQHSALTTIEELATLLETPVTDATTRQALTDGVAKALDELAASKEGNLSLRTELGARLNALESAEEVNADLKLFTETALSSLQDLDYAEAIARFSLQETALQAAQATFSRVSQLSLFNFL